MVVRYSEIGVKLGRTRRLFEEKLVRSIRCVLSHALEPRRIRLTPGRIVVEARGLEDAFRVATSISKVFGVLDAIPAFSLGNELRELAELIPELFSQWLRSASSFAIRVRRVEAYPVKSKDVERVLGAHVLEKYPHLRVNLESPELLIRVDIRSRRAYAYLDSWRVPGPGGLPYGVEGNAVIPLLECDDEELFAAWLAARRGARLVFVTKDCVDEAREFIERWVPCNDATIVHVDTPLLYVSRCIERVRALPVYKRVLSLPSGYYTLSPIELAPRARLAELKRLYRMQATPAL